MPKKLTEIPVECPCFVQEVRGEGYLRLFDLGFSETVGFCRCMNVQAAAHECIG